MKNQDTPISLRGMPFLLVVLICYGVLFLINSQAALLALHKASTILAKILPLFVVVILCTALINFLIKPKQIAKHLGKESGFKGWLWAIAAGVISHGPMYAWYPLFIDLRGHGLKDGLIVAFFASRTIKIPLLPIMVDYFGLTFTLVLSLYILLGALIQGLLLEFFTLHK